MAGLWIVGCVKSHCEQRAAENLARQDFPYYLPYMAEVVHARGRPKLVIGKPLFRGYVFIDIEHRRWQTLLSTQGLFGLIGANSTTVRPSMLPEGTVEALQIREDGQGLVVLPPFRDGDAVRITDGAFKYRQGLCQGMDHKERVKILLDYLGRKSSVLIAKELVEAVL